MEVTLGADTLIPVGSLLVLGGILWFFSTKVSELNEVKTRQEALDAAQLAHSQDDEAVHANMVKDLTAIQLTQARDAERWENIKALMKTLQEDMKKLLNR